MLAQVERRWAGVSLTVTTVRIGAGREWATELADRHLLIVNLGGQTTRLEAETSRGQAYFGAPTLGEMSLIPAGVRFGGVYQGTVSRFASLTLDAAHLAEVAGQLGRAGTPDPALALGVTDPFLFGCVRRLADLAGEHDTGAELFGQAVAASLQMHVVRDWMPGRCRTRPSPLPPDVVQSVQAYVAQHLAEALTLDRLSAAAGMAPARLASGFTAALGVSPAAYVAAQRLRRARWLLAHSATPLAEIAAETGYASQSHMTSVFRKRVGHTPASLRQELRRGVLAALPVP